MAKFNWGRALSSAGGSLSQYYQQQMEDERRAKERQAAWDHQQQMQLEHQNMVNPLVPTAGFGEMPSVSPDTLGGPVPLPNMMRINPLAKYVGMLPKEQPVDAIPNWAMKTETLPDGTVVYRYESDQGDLRSGGKVTPSSGDIAGGRSSIDVKRERDAFKEAFGEPNVVTSNRSVLLHEDGDKKKPVIGSEQFVQQEPSATRGNLFDWTTVPGGASHDLPGMMVTSADSLRTLYPNVPLTDIQDAAFNIHQPRIENRTNEYNYGIDRDIVASALGDANIKQRDDGSWYKDNSLWPDEDYSRARVAEWVNANKNDLGQINPKSLTRFMKDELGIENGIEFAAGGKPVVSEKKPASGGGTQKERFIREAVDAGYSASDVVQYKGQWGIKDGADFIPVEDWN